MTQTHTTQVKIYALSATISHESGSRATDSIVRMQQRVLWRFNMLQNRLGMETCGTNQKWREESKLFIDLAVPGVQKEILSSILITVRFKMRMATRFCKWGGGG
mmetsp:Transcript_53161/g.86080  ORF Transcript_53161/g.86080 Transcript_53161/m.86080 type:complete len:104 (+) Transcript_53161:283-594(+)